MLAGKQFLTEKIDEYLLVGELALDGRVRAVRGALAAAISAARDGRRDVIIPADNAAEAAVVDGLDVTCLRQAGRRAHGTHTLFQLLRLPSGLLRHQVSSVPERSGVPGAPDRLAPATAVAPAGDGIAAEEAKKVFPASGIHTETPAPTLAIEHCALHIRLSGPSTRRPASQSHSPMRWR